MTLAELEGIERELEGEPQTMKGMQDYANASKWRQIAARLLATVRDLQRQLHTPYKPSINKPRR